MIRQTRLPVPVGRKKKNRESLSMRSLLILALHLIHNSLREPRGLFDTAAGFNSFSPVVSWPEKNNQPVYWQDFGGRNESHILGCLFSICKLTISGYVFGSRGI